MNRRRIAFALAALLLIAACNNGTKPQLQGWIEADLIFVGPYEAGRIETLALQILLTGDVPVHVDCVWRPALSDN